MGPDIFILRQGEESRGRFSVKFLQEVFPPPKQIPHECAQQRTLSVSLFVLDEACSDCADRAKGSTDNRKEILV